MNEPASPSAPATPPAKQRRTFTREFKHRLVKQTLAPGASVSGIALANGINTNQLFAWRRQLMPAAARPAQPALLPIHVMPSDALPAGDTPAHLDGVIEIILAGGTVRLHGQVDPGTLRTVLQCLRR